MIPGASMAERRARAGANGPGLVSARAVTCEVTLAECTLLDSPELPAVLPRELVGGERVPGTPYLVVRRLGQGGMGEVYEAEHAELGRRAAIKLLHRRHHGRADLAARLRAEARLLARLQHPNLVEVFDLGTTADGRPWFVMPLLRGRDLREELARVGPLPVARAAALVAQALDGLAAAHAAGVVHRDVKLENLFLEEATGTVKVIDFGIARAIGGAELGIEPTSASPGTPRSMAPEQCSGRPVDARADVYAAGLALYELCAGRGPFDDRLGDEHALRWAQCARPPAAPSAFAPGPLPRALDAVVLRAIAKAPEERFPSAAAMAAAVRALVRPRAPLGDAGSALPIACLALGLALGTGVGAPPAARP